jgi:hypothetical protein
MFNGIPVPAPESRDTTNLMFFAGTRAAADLDDVGHRLSATVGGHDIIEHRTDTGIQISRPVRGTPLAFVERFIHAHLPARAWVPR